MTGPAPRITLFDLDHTLLDGDSNSLWIDHLVEHGLAEPELARRQAAHLHDYAAGRLDIHGYLGFQLGLFATRPLSDWQALIDAFIATTIAPRISAAARQAVAAHRAAGDRLAIVTATHHLLSEPIGALFQVPVIAPRAQVENGHASGRIEGPVCFREAKIPAVEAWLRAQDLAPTALATARFYSDSANDLPLLEAVAEPVVVNADARLAELATARGWAMLEWRRA
jgi:HAD superfamily hydrolase (TIGR01490 family)